MRALNMIHKWDKQLIWIYISEKSVLVAQY